MDLMKKIILSACFLSIVITIADSIKPGEKFSQQLKMIFSLIFITGVLSVAVKSGMDFEMPASAELKYSDDYSSMKETADRAVITETENKINIQIEKMLSEKGISYKKILSYVNIEEDNSIVINRIDYKGTEFEQARCVITENLGEVEVSFIE